MNRHLMALLTFTILLPLVYFIPPLVAKYISGDHWWVTFFSVSIIVPMLSYVLIPITQSIFRKIK